MKMYENIGCKTIDENDEEYIMVQHFGIKMYKPEITCIHSGMNNQCIGSRCPFKQKEQRMFYRRGRG